MHAYGLLPGQADREIYRQVLAGLNHHRTAIPCAFDPGRINACIKAVLIDHPGLFWFEGKWAWRQTGDTGFVLPQYTCDARQAHAGSLELLRLSRALSPLSGLPPLTAAREVYTWLLDHASYGATDTQGQSALDALVRRKAVCKGLSKAYQYLLGALGIFATLEEGTLDGVAAHVWNVVRIGDRYTNVDVSLGYDCFSGLFGPDDAGNRLRCFAVSDARLSKTHRWPSPKLSRLVCDMDIRQSGAP